MRLILEKYALIDILVLIGITGNLAEEILPIQRDLFMNCFAKWDV